MKATSSIAPVSTYDLELLTLTDVARELGRSRDWVYAAERQIPLPSVPVGRRRYFRRSDVQTWLTSLTVRFG